MKGIKGGSFFYMTAIGSIFVLWAALSPDPFAYGGEEKKDLPPRKISVAPEYTGVLVAEGEDVSIELNVSNKGRQDENIDLILPSVPKGWKASIKTYNFGVSGVHVVSDSSKSLTLKAEPDESVGPGKYTFLIKAQTQDGKLTSSAKVVIAVKEKEEVKETKGVHMTTSYPVLQGPTDARFEFSLDVENKSEKDGIFNLGYQGPENWEINFKPAYEEKFISSLRIKGFQSETMAVEVRPYLLAEPGRYPIKIKVSSPEAKGEVELTVVLTGTHELEVGTANGLVSLNALKGKEANLSLYVKNTGSATQTHIRFLSVKLENWKVDFIPETIETFAPGELKQIEVIITPAEEALVGDYLVGLSIQGEKVSKEIELRVTVRASTAWGGIGIGIIVLVIVGLVVLFFRLGRR